MPEKFLKFLKLIKDQLFYSPDYIVVLDQTAWEGCGMTEVDLRQAMAYLRKEGVILESTYYTVEPDMPIPTDPKARERFSGRERSLSIGVK